MQLKVSILKFKAFNQMSKDLQKAPKSEMTHQALSEVNQTLLSLFVIVLRIMLKRALCYLKQSITGKWIGDR